MNTSKVLNTLLKNVKEDLKDIENELNKTTLSDTGRAYALGRQLELNLISEDLEIIIEKLNNKK